MPFFMNQRSRISANVDDLMTDVAVVGDVHGLYGPFHDLVESRLMDVELVLQLGDFGFLHLEDQTGEYIPPPRPVHFIDGNHDSFPLFQGITEPTEIRENLIYVPRGHVLETEAGFRIGCLGGADSIDREFRTEGVSWFSEETITYADQARLVENHLEEPIDLLATHTPPATIVRQMGILDPGPSDRAVEAVWQELDRPELVCGHMHERKRFGSVQVLGELDVFLPRRQRKR